MSVLILKCFKLLFLILRCICIHGLNFLKLGSGWSSACAVKVASSLLILQSKAVIELMVSTYNFLLFTNPEQNRLLGKMSHVYPVPPGALALVRSWGLCALLLCVCPVLPTLPQHLRELPVLVQNSEKFQSSTTIIFQILTAWILNLSVVLFAGKGFTQNVICFL